MAAVVAKKSLDKALQGGMSGAGAMGVQVMSLMWLRTVMNVQYRSGGSLTQVCKTLYKEGGIPRFYRGLSLALVGGPLSRFGDTFANEGVVALMAAVPATAKLPVAVKTVGASIAAGLMRIVLTPVDTLKTCMQVQGKHALPALGMKIRASPLALFDGALANSMATMIGHYPWFATNNYLEERVPVPAGLSHRLLRSGGIGVASSFVSDVASNSVRVLKTYKQTSEVPITYSQALSQIVKKDGVVKGLMTRGLNARVLANMLSSMMFKVVWKALQDKSNKRRAARQDKR